MIYNYTKQINFQKLSKELASFPLSHVNIAGADMEIVMTRELDQQEVSSLDAIVGNHDPVDMTAYVKNKILDAMKFGNDIMAEYGASNVLAGLTAEQILYVLDKTSKVQAALVSGSLYSAISEANAIQTDTEVITTEKITEFRNKIEDYLGIPRT